MNLLPLLDHLATTASSEPHQWHDWRITPIHGGANNLLFRATNRTDEIAVKWTIRDERDRAGREYAALSAVQQAGLALAPAPLLLDRDNYAQPVVVQTWLAGEVITDAPQTDADWLALIEHFCAIHTVTPARITFPLRDAVTNAASVAAGRALIAQQTARVPPDQQPASLRVLLDAFDALTLPTWPKPPRALCRVDANCRNFIRRPGGWASVDWENSGWGDGAFEMVDLITHPAYENVPPERWQWVVEQYARGTGDEAVMARIQVYHTIMLVWWVARLARYIYEVPRNLDMRLVQHPAYNEADMRRKYGRYLARAWAQIRAWE